MYIVLFVIQHYKEYPNKLWVFCNWCSNYFCIFSYEWPLRCFELGNLHNIKINFSSAILNQNEVGHFEVSFDGQFCCWFWFSFLNESMSLFPQHHLITGNFHEEQTKGLFYLSIMFLRGENSLMQMKIIKAFCTTINCLNMCLCKCSTLPSETAASWPFALKIHALWLLTVEMLSMMPLCVWFGQVQ